MVSDAGAAGAIVKAFTLKTGAGRIAGDTPKMAAFKTLAADPVCPGRPTPWFCRFRGEDSGQVWSCPSGTGQAGPAARWPGQEPLLCRRVLPFPFKGSVNAFTLVMRSRPNSKK